MTEQQIAGGRPSVRIERESVVASYNAAFPAVFHKAVGSRLYDADGRAYVDFFSGAGANNSGHNAPALKQALIDYISDDGICNSLDLTTVTKQRFVQAFTEVVLNPRGFDHRLMFTGPTGTNAVEAALKLVRKVSGRPTMLAFTRGFHGVSLGALAATSNEHFRNVAGVPLEHVVFLPYDDPTDPDPRTTLEQGFASLDPDNLPGGAIVEIIQGEGGINAARPEWLQALRDLTSERGMMLVADDIQAGCGRSGTFFSFEPSGIVPDAVTLSKSLSGYGLPLSVVLIRPEFDIWRPAEHNGTFRGNNHAFVTATAAIDTYWRDSTLMDDVKRRAARLTEHLEALVDQHPEHLVEARGRGYLQGLVFADHVVAAEVGRAAFDKGLVIERSGPLDEVAKFMPALTIDDETLDEGLALFDEALEFVLSGH
ncbi:diaminobutyrate--2-oxoglutarate transaminase [Aestuariimicrobium ganziense]|uniref:diaminobutyrate--2-oxoglutarate transaminase n=1 Tax=Aestuariimicrobium ganziense TaxID=2773677 RepID=UPI001940A4CA|nr:diaminobutyrate--2-oxoglutarate transaminase [Aestuariimicrobium ganziense]